MKEDIKIQLMKLLDIDDESDADKVLQYSDLLKKPMHKTEAAGLLESLKANDYAIAKALNERTASIVNMVASAYHKHSFEATHLDAQALNKSYVLLVNELKKIYTRNEALRDITVTPAWNYLDIIEGAEWDIAGYIYENQNDAGQSHNAQVNKLCIIAGKEVPEYTPAIKEMVDEADKSITDYRKRLDKEKSKYVSIERKWFIPEYSLTYKQDGTILINDVLKLKKVHVGSAPDRLMEQAVKQPNTLFKPDLGQTSRNLSTILSSMGFSETLRALFFPTVSKDRGIVFRQTVADTAVKSERIDTYDLDTKLKEAGADYSIKKTEIPF